MGPIQADWHFCIKTYPDSSGSKAKKFYYRFKSTLAKFSIPIFDKNDLKAHLTLSEYAYRNVNRSIFKSVKNITTVK